MAKRRKSAAGIVLAAIAAALIFAVTAGIFIYKNASVGAAFSEYKTQTENGLESSNAELDALKAERDTLISEREDLKASLSEAADEQECLLQSFENSDVLYKQQNDALDALKAEISERDAKISALEENIKKLEKVYLVDINAQFDILNRLAELLANPIPNERIIETENEDGTVTSETVVSEANISLFYRDLRNGYTYGFNSDEVFDPASMIKAPYILALLEAASDEEAKIAEQKRLFDEAQAKIIADGGTPSEWQPPERRFDMEKKITYTREQYFQPGSGEIVESEDGTEYTYRELFYHVLECSDNVAYAILKEEYGNEEYSALVVRLGVTSMYKKPVGMSARDACTVMKAIYDFTESDAFYAAFMKDAMIGSRHLVIIPYGCSPYTVAHKYGWDVGSYCDMGIVYADAPYVVSILTDYDQGGKEVNEYLQSVLSLINQLHGNFYSQR